MATVIDALLVTLGLDASNFSRGAKQAEDAQKKISDTSKKAEKERAEIDRKTKAARDQQAKDTEQKTKQAAQGFNKLKNEALGFLAIFATASGLKAFAQDTIQTAASLGFMAANLGMSTKDLDAWQAAAERAGGSAGGMTAQLKESASEIAKYKAGMGPSEGMQWFLRLGGDPAAFKDGNTYLLARSAILEKLFKANPANAVLMAANMGVSEDTFNLLKKGPDAVMALVAAQREHSVITEQDAAQALELQNSIKDLNREFEAVSRRLLLDIVPVVTQKLMPAMREFSGWVTTHKPEISSFIDGLVNGTVTFGRVAIPILKMVADGWKNIFGWVGELGEKIHSILPQSWSDKIGEKMAEYFGGETTPNSPTPNTPAPARQQRTSSAPAAPGNATAIMAQLKSLGWTHEQAAGITGSFKQESGLNSTAVNPSSGARGIGQWLGSRVGDFKKWAGIDLKDSTTEQQINFFHHEVTNGKEQAAGRKLRAAKTAEDAARVHSEAYERPGKAEANNARRMQMAADFARMPVGAATAQRGNASTSTSTTDVKVGQITINTKATDAAGIAASIGPAVTNYAFVAQANGGM